MNLFKDILKDSETLIVDEIALDFDYVPKIIKHRENEQQYIATCIKPLLQGRNGKNLFVFGSPGIGKTCAIKWIIRDLENETDSVLPIYINCWKTETSYKIINEICRQVGYKFTLNKKTDELIRDISTLLNKKSAVIIFDEVDKLLEQGILYSLLEDIYKKTIILITNNSNLLNEMDQRVKSRLLAESLEFKPYNKEETKSILKERRDYAFVKGIWDEEAFNLIVDKAYSLNDMRTGLHLMRESALIAENNSSKTIKKEFIEDAIKKLGDFKINEKTFEEKENVILDLIKLNSGKKIKELHDLFISNGNEMPYRTFFDKIKKLEKTGLIVTKELEGPGKSTIVNYSSNKKLDEF
ncbi:MAG: AAA family ATPase [Candidatus Nanoarchaeia archaeon]|nr:AAA family ATPase [Candidatus Nanoarchaeia archaeon]